MPDRKFSDLTLKNLPQLAETFEETIDDEGGFDAHMKRQILENKKATDKKRLGLTDKIYWLLAAWMVFVAIIIVANMLNFQFIRHFESHVLIALFITSVGQVIGVFYFVVKYFFGYGQP